MDSQSRVKIGPLSFSAEEIGVEREILSDKFVEDLDLAPVMQAVARHAGTKLGRDSILSLINIYDDNVVMGESSLSGSSHSSLKKSRLSMMTNGAFRRPRLGNSTWTQSSYRFQKNAKQVINIAQTADDARGEWKLIQEAMDILEAVKEGSSTTYPPIYAKDSSPWDVDLVVGSDDDEWLCSVLTGKQASLTLENVLQAEQIVKRMLNVHEWAHKDNLIASCPGLAKVGGDIMADNLSKLHEDISDAVVIVEGRSLMGKVRFNSERKIRVKLVTDTS
jgi:hypothetical protein